MESWTFEVQAYLREAGLGEQTAAAEDKGQGSDCRKNCVNDLDLSTFKGVLFTERVKHHHVNPEP